MRRSSAGWMPARIGRLSAGVGRRRRWWRCRQGGHEHCDTKQEDSTLRLNALGLGWLFATLLLQHPNRSQKAASGARRVMSSSCEVTQDVSDTRATCPTPRYLGSEQKGRFSLLKLTFSPRLASMLRWKAADTIFVVLSWSFQVWRCSPSVAMSLLNTTSTACQSPSACMIARSSA